MTDNVVRFTPFGVGVEFSFDANEALEMAKDKGFTKLLIIGDRDSEDGLFIGGNCITGDALFLMEKAKAHLVFGED